MNIAATTCLVSITMAFYFERTQCNVMEEKIVKSAEAPSVNSNGIVIAKQSLRKGQDQNT